VTKVETWLLNSFAVDNNVGAEYKFPCPHCGHDNFYFNSRKLKGFCHRASCHFSPQLKDLVKIVGHGPDEEAGFIPFPANNLGLKQTKISLPETAKPLIYMDIGGNPTDPLMTDFQLVVSELKTDRNLGTKDIIKWSIHYDPISHRVIVPVYEEGKLVQYVGRLLWSFKGYANEKRYKYASGASIGKYLLGWGEAKRWEKLVLVENTFNAIWLRNTLYCSTNFGSHLSTEQIDKIEKSKVKSVVLLWDAGAEARAEKAVRQLHKRAINAVYCVIKGQPDNYHLENLKAMCNNAHEQSLNGRSLRFEGHSIYPFTMV